jgi:hypothetical protein
MLTVNIMVILACFALKNRMAIVFTCLYFGYFVCMSIGGGISVRVTDSCGKNQSTRHEV